MKIQMRFYSGYYDGPTSGLLEIDGTPYWFRMIDEEHTQNDDGDYDRERIFEILEMSEKEVKREWERHRDFEKLVGTHTCQKHWCGTKRGKVVVKWKDEFWKKYPIRDREFKGPRHTTITESTLMRHLWRGIQYES